MINLEKIRTELEALLERRKESVNAFAKNLGIQQSSLSRFLKGETGLAFDSAVRILRELGYSLSKCGPPEAKEICFVNARTVPTGDGQAPPQAEDYMAVPLVNEVGAGPGIIPQDELLSWFLVYKHQDAVRYRRNLVAVQIGKNSTSMEPVLHPGDVVLVDLDDRDISKPGRIMLVMDPMDGSGMIKRVAVEKRKDDFRVTFYSDNAAENPPLVYSLSDDFGKDWERVVAGHVVWAWSDISDR